MAVEAVGHQLDGAAISTMVFEAMAVTCRNRANFLNSMASGLSLETPFASGLRRRLMQRLWGKLSCHGGWAPSTGAACDHTNVATGRIRRFLRLYLACAYRLEAADTLHAIDRTQRDVFVALRVRFSRGHCLPVRRCRSFMAVRSGASDTGTARAVTKSECAVPLQAHDRTLFQSNIADSLCSQGAHFQSQGLVTHLSATAALSDRSSQPSQLSAPQLSAPQLSAAAAFSDRSFQRRSSRLNAAALSATALIAAALGAVVFSALAVELVRTSSVHRSRVTDLVTDL